MRALTFALCLAALPAAGQSPFPVDIGGPYALTNQFGEVRTQADPDGKHQLLFFGYANCLNICSAAMPLMGQVVDALAADGVDVTPVMITVAPDQDQVDTMGAPLAAYHPDFIGLTGSEEDLQSAYDAFKVEVEPLFQDPEYGWIYSHGSFIHLLDGQGELVTLLPPILDVDQAHGIVSSYVNPQS